MTKQEHDELSRKVYEGNECVRKIEDARRALRDLELGNRIEIEIGTYRITKELDDADIMLIKNIIRLHYQKIIDENQKRFNEL